jgi:hypothetical protein
MVFDVLGVEVAVDAGDDGMIFNRLGVEVLDVDFREATF